MEELQAKNLLEIIFAETATLGEITEGTYGERVLQDQFSYIALRSLHTTFSSSVNVFSPRTFQNKTRR
jgi:hypothetical protein